MVFQQSADVFEAECIGMNKALSWLLSRKERKAIVESDSMLTVDAVHGRRENVLEVGHIIDQCKLMVQMMPDVTVNYVRKQVSKLTR